MDLKRILEQVFGGHVCTKQTDYLLALKSDRSFSVVHFA